MRLPGGNPARLALLLLVATTVSIAVLLTTASDEQPTVYASSAPSTAVEKHPIAVPSPTIESTPAAPVEEEAAVANGGADTDVPWAPSPPPNTSTLDVSPAEAALWLCRALLLTWECMTVENCAKEHPLDEIQRWLPTVCEGTCNAAIQGLPCHTHPEGCVLPVAQRRGFVPGDLVALSQLQQPNVSVGEDDVYDGGPLPFVEVKDRTPAAFPPPFTCNGITVHPISMAAPREMFVGTKRRRLAPRVKGFTDLFPKGENAPKTFTRYGINEEIFTIVDVMQSRYGLTTRRYGWDCARHYELVAYGALPYFMDLPVAPSRVVGALKRSLFVPLLNHPWVKHNGALRHLSGDKAFVAEKHICTYKGRNAQAGGAHLACFAPGTVKEELFNEAKYRTASDTVYSFGEKFLTTRSVAAYMLQRAALTAARRVLYIHIQTYFEFNQVSLHHGLVDLGLDVVGYPRIDSHYKKRHVGSMRALEELRAQQLYAHGNGYLWGFRIHDATRRKRRLTAEEAADAELLQGNPGLERIAIIERIHQGQFDMVVYAGYNGGGVADLPFFRQVVAKFSRKQIVFLVTMDEYGRAGLLYKTVGAAAAYGHIFMRELYDQYKNCPAVHDAPGTNRQSMALQPGDLLVNTKAKCSSAEGAAAAASLPPAVVRLRQWAAPSKVSHTPKAVHSVILMDGYHWGVVYAGPALKSIRKTGCKATIVLLVPHRQSYIHLMQNSKDFHEFAPIRIVPYFNQSIPQDHFLFYAAARFLESNEGFTYHHVVVTSTIEARWYHNAFDFVDEAAMVVRLPGHRTVDKNYFQQCQHDSNGVGEWIAEEERKDQHGAGIFAASGLDGEKLQLAQFSGHWISGGRDAVSHLLRSMRLTLGFHRCNNEALLTTFLHRYSPSYVQVATSEYGPVVQHDMLTCSTMLHAKEARGHCDGPAAVIIHRCEGTP